MAGDPVGIMPWPCHSVVELEAYRLWVERNCPLWDDVTDWRNAQHRLREEAVDPARRRAALIKWRATELWLLNKCPKGRDQEFWYQAAEELADPDAYVVEFVAYALWEARGRPFGDATTDWQDALRLLASPA